jgi:hypothetical protein
VTITSAITERLPAVISRRMRAVVASFGRPAKRNSIKHLSHPELYGIPIGRVPSAGVVKECPGKLDASAEHAEATQALLPIGPCCC